MPLQLGALVISQHPLTQHFPRFIMHNDLRQRALGQHIRPRWPNGLHPVTGVGLAGWLSRASSGQRGAEDHRDPRLAGHGGHPVRFSGR